MREWRITWGSGILKGFAVGASGTEPPGRSPERGCGNSLQYSCLEKLTDRGAWQAAVHGVTKSQTRLKQLSRDSSGMPKSFPGGAVAKNPPARAGDTEIWV